MPAAPDVLPSRSSGRLVGVQLPPGPAFDAALETCWAAGDAVLPLPADAPPAVTARLVDALRPARLVRADGTEALAGAEPVGEGVAVVIPTSGSTGQPKGVELTASALAASAGATATRLGTAPGDRWLCCLPVHHIAGFAVLVRSRLAGTEPVVLPRFDVEGVARALGEVALVSLVPTMLGRLLDAGASWAGVRVVLLGGAPPAPGLLERAREAGAPVVVTYGMSETCGGCVYDGVPLDGVSVDVEAAAGDVGRIRLRGPVLMAGYRGRPDLTAAGMDGGWFRAADVGRLGADGRLEVLGRVDDVLITGGEKVVAGEVASLVAAHPRVAEVEVVGVPDPEWGQRVVAVVVAADPARPPALDDVRAFVRGRAAAPFAPRALVVVDALPRLPGGKVDRAALRALAGA